ncbi:MAG TPA: sigma 54-interacting transcriptional regulator [Polyangia bacterium]|nr:sigma 54-interacting transcriptional regulator [Polyangia bacterium]
MASPGSTPTSSPSPSTAGVGLPRRPAQLRWVFPWPASTLVDAGAKVIGRDPSCDTVLDGTEISRRHAELRVDGPLLTVRDLGSRNGVFVNGVRTSDAPIGRGDVLRCGEWVGVAVADADPQGLREIAPGWRGGPALLAAIAPARAAPVDLAIVIEGETGTGKEGLAAALHAWRGRGGSFVGVNCAALPGHMAEAELFGYRRGAFTGADRAATGFFRAADGGTLFLDEVLELPADVQPKLLRALQQRQVQGLGEPKPVDVDVAIVAAAQEPLANAVRAGRFRADLLARLDGLTVVLPPLRERRDDVVPLFREFLREHAGGRPPDLDAKLVEALTLYDWPLNVRELLAVARRLLLTHGHEPLLKRSHLPASFLPTSLAASSPAGGWPVEPSPARPLPARRKVDDAAEFDALVAALRANENRVAKAAEAIGVSRARAYRLLAARPDFSLEADCAEAAAHAGDVPKDDDA